MAHQRERRVLKEYRVIQELNSPPDDISASLKHNNLYEWTAKIHGPKNTPYEGGTFFLELYFDETYPHNPPEVKFLTKIWHPNIDSEGHINMEHLSKSGWSPVIIASTLILTISSFLDDPFPDRENPCYDEAIVPQAAEMWLEDRGEFEEKARRWTERYAVDAT